MTATSTARPAAASGTLASAARDALIIMWRNLKRVPRIPELAIFAVLQSIMFVLLFAYVFGGAIPIPGGGSYNDFLMPGIFAQNIVFASGITAIGMADDIGKGIIDRFRSLPMARSAVLAGRSFADVIYNLGILVVLMLSGVFVGWSVHTGIPELLAGVGLLLLFAFAMSWLGIWMGLKVPSVEVAQQAIFTVLFPITFLSNVFVPPQTLPDWLQPIAEWNPTSTLTASLRELWGNPNPYATDSFPSQNPILVTLVWVVVFIVIFAPLGIRRYRTLSR
ncbi:MAG TPA: ABC transporter permease [Candidatus Limnocylindrales bacterium]|jgi:ABC transporter DrrB family efflux protein|nr:ABC transporter permease [Candidatus Limnocylindrales bacterium]